MTELLAVVRAAHLAALAGLVGSLAFSILLLRLTAAREGAAREVLHRCDARLALAAWWCALAGLASAIAWLLLYTATATGRGLGGALDGEALGLVLTRTSFGGIWLVRMALLVAGALLLLWAGRPGGRGRRARRAGSLGLGAVGLAALAWTGHALTAEGLPAGLAPVLDAVHVLAAGVWLGGLGALAHLLRATERAPGDDVIRATAGVVQRFSALATGAVLALLLTGAVTAWALTGDVAGLMGTPYGWLLLGKLALVVPLLGLGARNRWRLTPGLTKRAAAGDVGGGARAIHRLRRSVTAEAVLGGGVLLVVGALGVTPPARHVDPWWPFPVRLSWTLAANDPATPAWLAGGLLYAAAGVVVLLHVVRRRLTSRWPVATGAGLVAYGLLLGVFAFPVIDAYPTTYLRPTVPYQAASIARGAELYERHCAVCHGPSGRGDGPAGQGLPREPADLTAEHTDDHTAGDLFWWLTHGIAGSGMPGFASVMSEAERWDVINFVRLLGDGERARQLSPSIGPWRVAAPDFTLAEGAEAGETLRDHRGRAIVHLVLFTLPGSRPRLEAIDRSWTDLTQAGARVVAVPMGDRAVRDGRPATAVAGAVIAMEGAEETAAVYRWLAWPQASEHVEFLIDRQGWLRARWAPGQQPAWSDPAVLLAEIGRLNTEVPTGPPPDDHVH